MPKHTQLLLVFVIVLLVSNTKAITQSQECLHCTNLNKVWCSQQLKCVDDVSSCSTFTLQWFDRVGSCGNAIVSTSDLCPSYDVQLDPRFTTTSGNMITVPIQPRVLLYDVNTTADKYLMGGYFSHVPAESEQTPYYFFFSDAVEDFMGTTYEPYAEHEADDYTPANVTTILQTLDLTVVGNILLTYNMSFVIAKETIGGNFECVYTLPTMFVQTPVINDFGFTLGVVGLVAWLVGIFVFVNFMMYFERNGIFKEKDKDEPNLKDPSEFETESQSDLPIRTCSFRWWRRYGNRLAVEWRKFVKSVKTSDQVIVEKRGVTVYHYTMFHRLAIIFMVACSVVGMTLGLTTDIIFGSERDSVAGDFATMTVASLGKTSRAYLVHFFIVIINVALGAIFIWRLRIYSFTVVLAGNTDQLPISAFTVEIRGLPDDELSEEKLLQHFQEIYGEDAILGAHIIPELKKAISLCEQKEHVDKELLRFLDEMKKTNERPEMWASLWDKLFRNSKVDAIDFCTTTMAMLDSYIAKEVFKKEKKGTGFAYIVFKDPENAKKCLTYYNHSRWMRIWRKFKSFTGLGPLFKEKHCPHYEAKYAIHLNSFNWIVKPAPLPEEIIWRNLGISATKTFLSRFFITVTEIVVFIGILSFTVGFAIFEVYRDLNLTSIYYDWGGDTLWAMALSNMTIILPEAIAIVDEVIAPVVEALEMKAYHKHLSGWRRTVMWNITFFEMLGGLVLSRMVYFGIGVTVLYYSSAPFNTYHYLFNKIGMDMMKYMCIKTFTVYGIKVAAIGILKLVEYLVSKEIERPDFDYYDMFGQKIVVIFCCLVWGNVMPLILPLCVMYLVVTWIIDKWLILTYYKKEPLKDSRLLFYAADIASLYIALVPAATLIIISSLYYDHLALFVLLLLYSVVACLWMHQSRRWQHLNQNIKGKRRVVVAKSKKTSTEPKERWMDTILKATNSQSPTSSDTKEKWKDTIAKAANLSSGISSIAKTHFSSIASHIRHGGVLHTATTPNHTIENVDYFKHVYKHPLC